MSRADGKSRIARALREDAAEAVRPDLDLWPLVSERLAARRASTTSHADAGAAMSRPGDTGGTLRRPGRKPTLHLSLTAALPVLVLVVAMVGAYLAPAGMLSWTTTGGGYDPCGLITQEEADGFVGVHLDQVQWEPVREGSFACAYNGEDESLNLLVARFEDNEQAARYLNNRLKSVSPSNVRVMLPEDDLDTALADGIPGVADEAYQATVRNQGNKGLYFRHIMARQGNIYFVVTWMTAKEEPSSELSTLAQRISERLRSW